MHFLRELRQRDEKRLPELQRGTGAAAKEKMTQPAMAHRLLKCHLGTFTARIMLDSVKFF
jgi:hypothetical protein